MIRSFFIEHNSYTGRHVLHRDRNKSIQELKDNNIYL